MSVEFDPRFRQLLVEERLARLAADAAPTGPGSLRRRLGLALVALGERLARVQRVPETAALEPLV